MMTIPTPHRATGAWNATKKAGPAGNIHPMDVSITTPTRSFDTDGAEPSPIFWLTRLSPASAPQFATCDFGNWSSHATPLAQAWTRRTLLLSAEVPRRRPPARNNTRTPKVAHGFLLRVVRWCNARGVRSIAARCLRSYPARHLRATLVVLHSRASSSHSLFTGYILPRLSP